MLSHGHHRAPPSPGVRRQHWAKSLRVLLPSFVADSLFPEHKRTWKLHPTSYLDGLRGIAAMIVFFCHYTENNFRVLTPSYGLNPDGQSSIIQLPYLRCIFSGRPMVHIFFVISGFVLSYKPVKALHARDLDRCYSALASSAFRRPFRLFGPCIVSTFIILCLRQMGLLLPAMDTWGEEFWKWRGAVFRQITWPWAWDHDLKPAYDIHLWTIPIEFAHSMLLFLVLLMLSRVRLAIRMGATLGLVIYCLKCGKWAAFEFLAGLLLAEIHVLQYVRPKEWASEGQYHSRGSAPGWPMRTLQFTLIAICMFVAGWPNRDADKTPGIRYLLEQTPLPFAKMDRLAPQKFWFGLSAVAMVWVVGELEPLRRFFESPLAQYCGRISYAVYICHGPVEDLFKAWLLGNPPVPAHGLPGDLDYKPPVPATGVKGIFGTETPFQITAGWFAGLCLLGPLVIWAADLFWRAVDDPIVRMARRFETLCLDETPDANPRGHGYSVAA